MEDFNIDDSVMEQEAAPIQLSKTSTKQNKKNTSFNSIESNAENVCCLRSERVIIRHVPKENSQITNPKHILSGGMADGAVRYYTLPRLESGVFVNPLTSSEKNYLEQIMGLEYNALSIYLKVDNYWENLRVRVTKQDTFLNLSDPSDYIKYKVLLANKNLIAPSLQAMQDFPKSTYQFVIILEGEEIKSARKEMSSTMESYMEYGKISEDIDTLRVLVESLDGRPTSQTVKLEFLQTQINKLIQSDNKSFLKVIKDPYLSTKVLIKKSIEAGLISKRGDYLYLKSDNSPLCEINEEPTLNIAAKYLNHPKHQEFKLTLEAKLK